MASHELTPNAAHIREGREEWRGDALRKERDRDGERRKRSGSQVRQAQAKVLILALVIGGSQLLCLPGRVDEDEWAYEEHDATHGLRAQSIDGPTERCGGAGPLPHNAYRYRSSCSLSFPRSTVPFPEAVTWRSFGPRRSGADGQKKASSCSAAGSAHPARPYAPAFQRHGEAEAVDGGSRSWRRQRFRRTCGARGAACHLLLPRDPASN